MTPRIALLTIAFLLSPLMLIAQQPQQATPKDSSVTQQEAGMVVETVVLSGVVTTARIADPNERVVFNGHVMRMADFVAAVSSSNEAAQRLRTPEKRNREKDQPTPPLGPTY